MEKLSTPPNNQIFRIIKSPTRIPASPHLAYHLQMVYHIKPSPLARQTRSHPQLEHGDEKN